MKKIVMLCKKGDSTYIVYNKLSEEIEIAKVIVEDDVPRREFLKRRIKKYGWFTVLGQIAFVGAVVPILKKRSEERKREILHKYNASVDDKKFFDSNPLYVDSVNDAECIAALKNLKPDIVVVNGTRIISKEVLNCIDAKFINMHAGITPKYRGAHGAYWALYNDDRENAGVTVHFVDKGIDTGSILYQSTIPISEKDNFVTYPILQTCVGAQDELRAIKDIINDKVLCKNNDLPSGLYSHPTIFQYIWKRIFNKIR
ncbi:MAG: formyl transferase [Clostridia bacterium]|nr:formyl transferase [Clostridia bacterium]